MSSVPCQVPMTDCALRVLQRATIRMTVHGNDFFIPSCLAASLCRFTYKQTRQPVIRSDKQTIRPVYLSADFASIPLDPAASSPRSPIWLRCRRQNTDRQLEGQDPVKVFTDRASGKDTMRPQLRACLEYIREGDVLVVHSMDRLARNLDDLGEWSST